MRCNGGRLPSGGWGVRSGVRVGVRVEKGKGSSYMVNYLKILDFNFFGHLFDIMYNFGENLTNRN